MWQVLGQICAVTLFVWFVYWISVRYGKAQERAVFANEDKSEYERMQKIHSANSAMSASQRIDWLRKRKEQ